nr:Chain B, Glutamate decarboxylase [Petunia x hybrida]1NWD_C Chain C, Glutamate decarboxylase [Petunia x hybrida]
GSHKKTDSEVQLEMITAWKKFVEEKKKK